MNRSSTPIGFACMAIALSSLAFASPTLAQNPVHTHIGHVADGFRGTPDGLGLLPTAVAEAEIANQHAMLAGRDPADLEAMQRHMAHVIHALDPSKEPNGPGKGYGVVAAAEGAARHIELSAASEGASDGVKTHANHVATAARSAAASANTAIRIAQQIQKATDAAVAAELLTQLTAATGAVLNGVDANNDGRIGWQAGEGGLAQATTHLGLLKSGEGLGG
jgi:hypothetical protein